jgi:hypothetical protein
MPPARSKTVFFLTAGIVLVFVTDIGGQLCQIDWEACYMRFQGMARREYPASPFDALKIAVAETLRQPDLIFFSLGLGAPYLGLMTVAKTRTMKAIAAIALLLPAIAALYSWHDCDRKGCDAAGLWLAYFLFYPGIALLAALLIRRLVIRLMPLR